MTTLAERHRVFQAISIGSMLARVTHAAIARQMDAIMMQGSFKEFSTAASGTKINAMLVAGSDTEEQNDE